MKNKKISTSALAKKHNRPVKEMFAYLSQQGLIEKKGDYWSLTNEGVAKGGKFVNSQQFGKYITWPEDIEVNSGKSQKPISAAKIGKHFGISPQKVNYILSELGWTQKYIKGWRVTLQGEKVGGLQHEDKRTGVPYVKWPESIIKSKIVLNSIQDITGTKEPEKEEESNAKEGNTDFREKFPAKHRTTDGHFVRSKAEMIIDNWLYMAEIVHAYERKLPIEEEVYSDFYIPQGKVYVEFWGYENNEKYLARKKTKQDIYKKYGFNLIELTDEDVLNIDDTLPGQLLKFGVQAY
jgi:hypothetical protein